MAQTVATPKFYINLIDWINTSTDDEYPPIYNTLPVGRYDWNNAFTLPNFTSIIPQVTVTNGGATQFFFAVLGHNSSDVAVQGTNPLSGGTVINYGNSIKRGFTLAELFSSPTGINISGNQPVGSVITGMSYKMVNNPNMNLSLSYDYGGVKETKSMNGSSYSNAFYTSPPGWGDYSAWELYDPNIETPRQNLSRSGRRIWNLTFSFIGDSDLWGSNQMFSDIAESITTDLGYESDDIHDSTTYKYNLLTDENFFSSVWLRTLGGTLPFLFQPNSNNNNPDQLAICRFKNNSLKVKQSAFNVYDISLQIEEAW